jgi:hypothetical protein
MDPDKVLQGVQEEQEEGLTGWNKERARATISRSLNILDLTTTHVEKHLTDWLNARERELDQAVRDYVDSVDQLRSLFRSTPLSRSDNKLEHNLLTDATRTGNALLRIAKDAPRDIIGMAADLTKMLQAMVNTTQQVNKIVAQLDAALDKSTKGPFDITQLAPDQLLRIMEIVQEARE